MNKSPLISIIIPNYNNEKYLSECLDSCIKQTYKSIEILIVDDCSTDKSGDIIKEYQKKDNRIKLIQNETNQKVSKTRHIGIENSIADWVTTLDSDDFYISKEKIQREVELLEKHDFNKNTIAYSGIVHVKENGEKIRSVMEKSNTKEGDVFNDIVTRSCAIPRDFIFSKELYYEIGGFDFDISIYEDWDLKLRLSKQAKYFFTGIDAIGYRLHGTGLSSAKRKEHIKWLNYVFDKNTRNLKNKDEFKIGFDKNIYPSIITKVLSKLKRIISS